MFGRYTPGGATPCLVLRRPLAGLLSWSRLASGPPQERSSVLSLRAKHCTCSTRPPDRSFIVGGRAAVAEVQLSGVCKSFGPIEALRGINLMIPGRAYLCLLGHPGLGKAAVVPCVVGLVAATR